MAIIDDDVKNLVKADEHAKDIAHLSCRLEQLEKKFGTDTQLAETLLLASAKASDINKMLEIQFLDLMKKNEPVRLEIKSLIQSEHDNKVKSHFRILGGKISGILIFLSGALSIEFIKFIFKSHQ